MWHGCVKGLVRGGTGHHDAVIKQQDAVLYVDGLADGEEACQGRVIDVDATLMLDEVQQVAKTWLRFSSNPGSEGTKCFVAFLA